jgi:peptidase A4-like protein
MFGRRLTLLAAASLLGALTGISGISPLATAHRPIAVVGANQSSNWSGYNQGTLEQGNEQFNQVSGTWRVPTATQHMAGEAEYSSTWVGIGGGCVDAGCTITDATLIQAGTEQDVDANGVGSYSAWYELIPEPATTITGMAIHAGDRMSVSIEEDPAGSNMWTFAVKDLSTGESFVLSAPYASTHATAEWITETPVVIDNNGNVTVGPLPDLSRVTFDRAATNGRPANLQGSEEIQMVDPNSSRALATPSGPDPDNDGFNDCTYASSCKAPKRS